MNIEAATIVELIDGMAQTQPQAPFLISPDIPDVVTSGTLQEHSQQIAAGLQRAGLKPGDKIAFLLDNGLFTAQLFLGSMYGGFVAVPLNVRAGVSQLGYTLDHSDANILFVGDPYTELAEGAMAGIKRAIRVIPADADHLPPLFDGQTSPEMPLIAPDDEALLMYTSGSVGQPKAAVHTHRTILAQARNSVQSHQLSSSDRSLLVLPLYHINAECVTLIPTLLSGGSVVVPHGFNVSRFWDWLEEHCCTWSAIVPTIVSQLLDWKDPLEGHRQDTFARIRFLRSSSAPLSPAQHREFLNKFDLLLIQAMGSSEAGNIFSNPLPPGENKIGSPGLAWGFETRIVNRDGIDVAGGDSGEVLIRGEAVMRGYYKDPEGTRSVLTDDAWLHTGDLAYQDEDGYFFVVGRSKELIIKGGMNIAPRQIDDVLEAHPGVLEAAVVGVPDRHLGEDLVAFAVLRAGITVTEKELLSFCQTRLGDFKTPTRIYFVSDLPKGPSGKVQRLRLLDQIPTEDVLAPIASGELPPVAGSDASSAPEGSGSIEAIIARIWATLLGQPTVDLHSNFFALGGHSLLAIQCLSQLREELPVTLSLSDFFDHGTIAQLSGLIRRRMHLGRHTDGQFRDDSSRVPTRGDAQSITRRDTSIPCPLSPGQQRLWFMEQLHPGLPVYCESEAVRLRGNLNVDALEQALNAVIARHEVLRSTIQVAEEPVQVVHQSWPLKLKKIDLSKLTAPQREAEVARLLTDEPKRPYHLEAEPGIRATLLCVGPQDHVFILMMHHIICDWSSEGVLWRELSAVYRAIVHGESPVLAPLPIQQGDYATWQVQQLAKTGFAEDLAFWENNLRGAPPLLDLPADRPRPGAVSHRGARVRFQLTSELSEALRQCSRLEKTSLFSVFAAALNVLLHRYTGSEDILLGIPIADRDRPELQSVIGFLLHTHVLRTKISDDLTFRELLARVQRCALDLYTHRAVPFDQVVRRVQPERNLGFTPLFQVMLNWRDREQEFSFIGLDGMEIESLVADSKTSKFDLTLFVTEEESGICLEAEYSTDLFNEDRIFRMFAHYRSLLTSVAADPGRRIAECQLLTAEERHQLLFDWNRTELDYPRDRSIHQLFEEQTRRTPDAVAVEFGAQRLSYRQLDERADRLASRLHTLGVRPDDLVGISVERSLEMVVGLLGILKAGGTYLPLDPTYPQSRRDFVLEDSGARIVLTRDNLQEPLDSQANHQPGIRTNDGSQLPIDRHDSTHLAYVLYTSGSTGKPKGVQVSHRAVINLLNSMRLRPGMIAQDTLLSVTTLSFDIFGLELWLPLMIGARVVIAPDAVVKDGAKLASLIKSSGATIMQATPYTWRLLLESGWEGRPGLKILCGGEAWHEDLATRLLPKCASLWNMYGPTETTIWSAVHEVKEGEPVLVGRPIANTQFYVVDSHLQPVPIGVAGELLIGGDGLARGYWNRPQLMAEKFIENPFGADPATRLFRTGDSVRYRVDGTLEFLGRIDHQVKIRGFRIELGEIEAVLRSHPGVREAAVNIAEHAGEKQLIAYLVAHASSKATTAEFRTFAKGSLPDYMVPDAWVFLSALPLTANGKLDRASLPAPSHSPSRVPTASGAPRDVLEQQLTRLWEKVLGIRGVGRHDNFFDLGGHSFAAVRLLAEIKSVTGRELPLAILFQASTVAGIAEILRKDGWTPSWSSLVPMQPGGSKRPLFLVHGAEGNVLLYRQLAHHLGSDQPVYGFQSQGLGGNGRFQSRVEDMAAHYVKELRAFEPTGPYLLGGYCLGGTIALEMAQQLTAQGKSVALLVLIDTYNLRKISRKSLRRLAPAHLAQNLWFHAANLLSIRNGGRWRFVREKLDTAGGRLRTRISSVAGSTGIGSSNQERYPRSRVRRMNDRAALDYMPQQYQGRMLVIRCKGHFWKLDDPALGWGDIAETGLEVHAVPVYRKGILVEPFVRTLATDLRTYLDSAQAEGSQIESRFAAVS